MKALPQKIATLLDKAAKRHGVTPALARAVAWVESRGRADVVSSRGAIGVMQLMPATARGLGVSDPFNPAGNIDGGVRFLATLLKRFGSQAKALAAYNWGPTNVDKGRQWPSSVRNYIRKVRARLRAETRLGRARPGAGGVSGIGVVISVASTVALLLILARGRRRA